MNSPTKFFRTFFHMNKNKKRSNYRPYKPYVPYILVFPAIIYFIIFTLYPIFFNIFTSLTRWNLITEPQFVGLLNYINVLMDPALRTSLTNSLILAFVLQPIITLIGFLLALALNSFSSGRRNIILFLLLQPFIVPMAVSATIWSRGFYDPLYGYLNAILTALGLPRVSWLGDPNVALISIAIVNLWAWVGYHSLIYLAGLQNIPSELIDAARVDGASEWYIVFKIIIPLLKPVFAAVLILATIGGLQIFTEVYMLTKGGPGYSTYTLGYAIYDKAFIRYDYGTAAALSLMLSTILWILALIELRILGGRK